MSDTDSPYKQHLSASTWLCCSQALKIEIHCKIQLNQALSASDLESETIEAFSWQFVEIQKRKKRKSIKYCSKVLHQFTTLKLSSLAAFPLDIVENLELNLKGLKIARIYKSRLKTMYIKQPVDPSPSLFAFTLIIQTG